MDDKPRDAQGRVLKAGDVVELLYFDKNTPGYAELGVDSLERFVGQKLTIQSVDKLNSNSWKGWVAHLHVTNSSGRPTTYYFDAKWCRLSSPGLKGLVQRYEELKL